VNLSPSATSGACHKCPLLWTPASRPFCPQGSNMWLSSSPEPEGGMVEAMSGPHFPRPWPPPPYNFPLLSQIIQDRIFGTSARPSLLWNSPPGALLALPTFSMSPQDFPFYHLQRGMFLGWDNLKSPSLIQ
jgi:hypothetical protein